MGVLSFWHWLVVAVVAMAVIAHIIDTSAKGTPLATIAVTTSDRSTFSGTLTVTNTLTSGFGAILDGNLVTGIDPPLPTGGNGVTVTAMQNGCSVSLFINPQVHT
jgi:hypothetical protein